MIVLNSKYLFSAVGEDFYARYQCRVLRRKRRAHQAFIKGVIGNSLLKAKDSSPWRDAGESNVLLDPQAWVSRSSANELNFDVEDMHPCVNVD